ncbi:hypothetical protein BJV82DRAFT_146684 [Fennellomyces sp. T-0311]|nr:hypothetical protein BJV82DRAFT_146684 [Fennellomyces sp. T-0311]
MVRLRIMFIVAKKIRLRTQSGHSLDQNVLCVSFWVAAIELLIWLCERTDERLGPLNREHHYALRILIVATPLVHNAVYIDVDRVRLSENTLLYRSSWKSRPTTAVSLSLPVSHHHLSPLQREGRSLKARETHPRGLSHEKKGTSSSNCCVTRTTNS